MAQASGNAIRSQRQTSEKLEKLTGLPDRRIEVLRSFTEEGPVYLEDFLCLAAVLGPQFVTGVLSEVDMYANRFNGASPEKIAAEAIQLLEKIAGGRE
jgi:hypothetical protein